MNNKSLTIGGIFLSLLLTGCPTNPPPETTTSTQETQPTAATLVVDATEKNALQQAITNYIKQQKQTVETSDRFFAETIDLNGDSIKDGIVVFSSPYWCGTGGCTMLIFQGQKNHTYRLVSTTSLVRPPLTVSETKTNGWRDLIFTVSGGGMPAKTIALKFDGKKYPTNPSDLPSLSAKTPIKGTKLFPEGSQPQTLSL
ncbi:hypothetical protein [Floridanema evergladense]|uniref:Lipoprotein n=1 Tax=Floridaenema evergladense BLCC-F167 TaxID=3153639 RepID=A0ABV4WM07_9CYAN